MEELRSAFAALGQSTRMRIFEALLDARGEGLNHGEIAARLNLPKALLTMHLAVLEAERLVSSEREGKFKRYRVDADRVRQLAASLVEGVEHGSARTDPAE